MASISYSKLWESEFDNIVSKKDKVQDLNNNQFKLELHHTYEKKEKITTFFQPINEEDDMNKAYLDEKLFKLKGHISLLEKNLQRIYITIQQTIYTRIF